MKRQQQKLAATVLVVGCGLGLFYVLRKPPSQAAPPATPVMAVSPPPRPAVPVPPPEAAIPVSLNAPASVPAGQVFSIIWWGPNAPGDFVTIVSADAPMEGRGDYKPTGRGQVLHLTAPKEPGPGEIRYVAGQSKTVLGRIPITVLPIPVTLEAPGYAVLGSALRITWSGPNNPHDYLTVVPAGAPDDREEEHIETRQGSPLDVNVPETAGDAEIRYVSGTDHQILGRRPLVINLPITSLTATDEHPAGSSIEVKWVGPDQPGDCITIVPKGTKDGVLGNYTATAKGSPLQVRAPIDSGNAELRYVTGRQHRVLARSQIKLLPVAITLIAPSQARAKSVINVQWSGPANDGDYLTIIPLRDAVEDASTQTVKEGSPTEISVPGEPGPAELRYVSGQGNRTLGRQEITITPPTP